jgi:hypothetical protein
MNSNLIVSPSQFDFFLDRVRFFGSSKLSDEVTVYLSQVLCRMSNPENLFQIGVDARLDNKPFCIQLMESGIEGTNLERALSFQRTGEAILFYSSFFRAKIEKNGMTLNYFFDLGRHSFLQAGNLNQRQSKLFLEVSNNFKNASNCISLITLS